MVTKLPGTQDFIDLSLFNYIVTQFKKHLEIYHFTEIATPIIESTELYRRSHIDKQLFLMATDQESIALRPEATSSIVRAYVENKCIQIPWKVYTCGPMFRCDRSKKQRYQQFHEISVEVLGAASLCHDVQLITMFDRFLSQTLSLNGYALMLNFLGCLEDQTEYKKKLKLFLKSNKAEDPHAPRILDHLCTECADEWTQLQDQLDLLSVTYTWNPSLIPDFNYYNKTVFKFSSAQLGAQSEFCCGGRHDQLIQELGGQDRPSIGAALNIEQLMILLEPLKETLPLPQAPALIVIVPLGIEQQMLALLIADNLQAQGLCVDLLLEIDSATNMLRKANKMGASWGLILGHKEQQERIVTIKNMITGAEDTIQQSDIYTYVTR